MMGRGFVGRLMIGLVLVAFSGVARAETVEVAPGVQVTRTTFDAPADEQPFYGFTAKTKGPRAADEKLLPDLIAAAGSREQAFEAVTLRGWKAIQGGRAVVRDLDLPVGTGQQPHKLTAEKFLVVHHEDASIHGAIIRWLSGREREKTPPRDDPSNPSMPVPKVDAGRTQHYAPY